MYKFDMNWRYNQPIVAPLVPPIVLPIQIKHVHSSVSYQWVIYQKYNRHGHASPSGYGPFAHFQNYSNFYSKPNIVPCMFLLSDQTLSDVFIP